MMLFATNQLWGHFLFLGGYIMSEFLKMNPVATMSMIILSLLLVGSFEHSWDMQSDYFQLTAVAFLVVLAYEVAVLIVAWQKGADVLKMRRSPAMRVFTGVVMLNVFLANLSQSFEHKFNMPFTYGNIVAGHDPLQLIMWLVVGATLPLGVVAIMHVISHNFSRQIVESYQETISGNEINTDEMTVDELKEHLQRQLNATGVNVTVTDEMLAKHLGVDTRTIRRRRKKEQEEQYDFLSEVNIGRNGKVYHE
jgi:hypothetical protein